MYRKHCFCILLCPISPPRLCRPLSVQMWSRWPSTGSQETSTLWMTWTTGSLCVTRTGRHVSHCWTWSCTILKALLWTRPWGQFELLLSVLCMSTHTHTRTNPHTGTICVLVFSMHPLRVPPLSVACKLTVSWERLESDWCHLSLLHNFKNYKLKE